MFSTVTGIVSVFVAATSLFLAWRNFRENALRRGDVLAWANSTIKELQGLLLVCRHSNKVFFSEEAAKAKLTEIIFNTAVLTEQGRLFFNNEDIGDGHGKEKERAYRGYRPVILDQIVLAHQIARHWTGETEDVQLRMRLLAEDCLKKFVSLAQEEVGRGRTRSQGARKAGEGRHLRVLLTSFDEARVETLRQSAP